MTRRVIFRGISELALIGRPMRIRRHNGDSNLKMQPRFECARLGCGAGRWGRRRGGPQCPMVPTATATARHALPRLWHSAPNESTQLDSIIGLSAIMTTVSLRRRRHWTRRPAPPSLQPAVFCESAFAAGAAAISPRELSDSGGSGDMLRADDLLKRQPNAATATDRRAAARDRPARDQPSSRLAQLAVTRRLRLRRG